MLTRLKITGFKNLVDVDVRFGPFTCIAGVNGVGNPLRQVIINTHSPAVVAQIPEDSLLVAESIELNESGKRYKAVRFSPLQDTWRHKKTTGEISVVSKGKILSYLNPVAAEDPDGYGVSERKNNIVPLKRRVIDRPDLQPYLPASQSIDDFSPLRSVSAFQALENQLKTTLAANGWKPGP